MIAGKKKGNAAVVLDETAVLAGIVLVTTDMTTGASVPRAGINRLGGKVARRDKKSSEKIPSSGWKLWRNRSKLPMPKRRSGK